MRRKRLTLIRQPQFVIGFSHGRVAWKMCDRRRRGVFDRSHIRLASSARRLVIEATYPL